MNHLSALFCLCAWVLFSMSAPAKAEPAGFVDSLDSPAIKTPRASNSQLIAVAQVANRLVAAGEQGRILVTDDFGAHWTQQDVPLSADLVAVSFADAENGWVSGHYGVILRTTDGGRHWVKQLDGRGAAKLIVDYYQRRLDAGEPGMDRHLADARMNFRFGAALPFLDVWFPDKQTGYAIGSFGLIMATADGGSHWLPWMDRIDNPDGLHLNSIRTFGNDTYIASERGTVFRYDRDKRRFMPAMTGYRGSFFGLVGGKGYVIAFGLRGNAFKSVDGGKTWKKVATGTDANLNSGTTLDSGRLILATQTGSLLASDDAGESFSPLPLAAQSPIAGVSAAGKGRIAVAGMRGVRIVELK